MVELLLIQRFAIALALGALIGLEREYARYKERGHLYAGIRTFPLITLFGALSAYLGDLISVWILVLGMLLIGVVIILAYFAVSDRKHIGTTSEVAGLLAFFIGVLCYYNEVSFAVILAIIIAVILYARSMLHHFAERISQKELGDTLKFAVIAFVVLPFLPNQDYGPLGVFNPYLIWLMVVFISGIGFIGYALMKWFGQKGIFITGLLGGIVSSTAATTSFAERSVKEKKNVNPLVLGVLAANGIMFVKILVEVFAVNRDLFLQVVLPLLGLLAILVLFSYSIWKKAKVIQGKVNLTSPLSLKPALTFAFIFAAILALVKFASVYLSSQGVYLISFLSGIADVDAITLSLSQLAKEGLASEIAVRGILIAALTNLAVKGGIVWWIGGKEFRKIIVGFFLILILLGILVLFFV